MTIYFEGDGKSRPVTITECRDQFVSTLQEMRDRVLESLTPADDSGEYLHRDRTIANRIIYGMLDICDGGSDTFPSINLIPTENPEDIEEAKAAGANYFDTSVFADFGGGLAEYWNQVNG